MTSQVNRCSSSTGNIVDIMKESLNSDGQQFHQYQQKEQPFLTSKHWTHK